MRFRRLVWVILPAILFWSATPSLARSPKKKRLASTREAQLAVHPLVAALVEAAALGRTATMQALLDQGANVNAKDQQGSTALIAAVAGGNAGTVNALLAGGADVNARDRRGSSALIEAVAQDHTDMIQALLARGADVNVRDAKGRTALAWALSSVSYDYNPTLQIFEKRSYANLDIVSALVASGADTTAKGDHGWTALTVAAREGRGDIYFTRGKIALL